MIDRHAAVRPPQIVRRAGISFAVVILVALSAPAGRTTAGEALDRSAMLAHVEARADETAGDAKLAKAYLKLVKDLSRESVRGLSDDYKVLKKVAAALSKVLVADAVLDGLLDDMLDAAEASMARDDGDLATYAELLLPGKGRDKVGVLAAKARAAAQAARDLRAAGDDKRAIAGGGKAATSYDKALAAAVKLRQTELAAPAEWSAPITGLAGALLSVWGEPGPAPALYAVGANDGGEPLFLVLKRFAEAWVRVPTRLTGDLWWVTVVPGGGVWASGTRGNVLRYDPATGAVEDRRTGVEATLYGIWGFGPDDVWAVGGDPLGNGPRPALLHWDGVEWTSVAVPPEAEGKTLFKVYGAAPDDVWACGQGGVLIRYDGDEWTAVPSGAASALLTLHGAAPMTAVGGAGVAAVIVERGTAGAFAPASFAGGIPALNGVFVPTSGAALAVGFSRTVLERNGGSWAPLADVPATARDLHSVWIDDEGNAVMVGGNLFAGTDGVIVARGRRPLPSDVFAQARFRDRVQPILYDTCAHAGCHLTPFPNEGLDFTTAEISIATAVGKPSVQSPLLRVAPGRPSKSYLWHKVLGTYESVGGSGEPMPNGADALAPEELEIIYSWILEGALDN